MGDWFDDHYDEAADAVLDFLAPDGLGLEDRIVADVGCGDGIIDLALAHRGRPRSLVGYDLNAVDVERLRTQALERGKDDIPPTLSFAISEPTLIPAPDDTFDAVITWSAFEHVGDPVTVLREIGRVLKPDGFLFLQIWPLFHSQHGGHLWPWTPEPFPHLMRHPEDIREEMLATGRPDAEYMAREVRYLNRATIDDLQRSILAAGLAVRKLELLTSVVHIPQPLMRYPLSDLGIAGVKLIATPLN